MKKILFVGDVMPGGVLPYQDDFIDGSLLNHVSNFSCRIATLECALGNNGGPFDPIKMKDKGKQNIVFSREPDLQILKKLNINVVSLANNHAMDCGLDGLFKMKENLNSLGITSIGAGANLDEARRPAIIDIEGRKIAIIAFQLKVPKPWCFYPAADNSAGIYHVSVEDVCSYVRVLKNQFDYVVTMPHWGEEHSYMPTPMCLYCAKQILRAGADLIIGSHPHIINPVVSFNGKKCYFSLGNFLFPDKCMQVPRPMYYPETVDECHSLKRMWTYPKSISEPIVAVWKPQNRIGMMVEMNTGGKIKTSYRLTCLTEDNVLHHYDSLIIRLRMSFWAFLVKMPKYGIIRRIYNHRNNVIRRAFDKLPAFNIPVKL